MSTFSFVSIIIKLRKIPIMHKIRQEREGKGGGAGHDTECIDKVKIKGKGGTRRGRKV
jgi:hypothetical protein